MEVSNREERNAVRRAARDRLLALTEAGLATKPLEDLYRMVAEYEREMVELEHRIAVFEMDQLSPVEHLV